MASHPSCLLLLVLVILCAATSLSDLTTFPARRRLHQNDVFISFRGKDVRRVFLSHLIRDFSRKQIIVFVDYELERGDEISTALARAIERSQISLVIFSVNYAYSCWCLEELLKILECRARQGQVVVPVFYNVDPSHVRHQRGSYGNAFVEHEKKQSHAFARLERWRCFEGNC